MKTVNVKNLNEGKNQFEVVTEKGVFFQSYQSVIVFIPHDGGAVQLDATYWDFSKTTGKYRNIFLGENKKETEKKIKDGIYILTNLN